MIKLNDLSLDATHLEFLSTKQNDIDSLMTYQEKVKEAPTFWTKASKTTKAFIEVKRLLTAMCSGHSRCMFCEDSHSNEIEHFKPKSIYPEHTFDWGNFLYACGICNGGKSNKFAVFSTDNDTFEYVTPPHHKKRPVDYVKIPPPLGIPVLINPRKIDPFGYLLMDLQDFRFVPLATDENSKEYQIADFTINTVLNLNRPLLPEARKTAFKNFRAILSEYESNKRRNNHANLVKDTIETISENPHITVWLEMIRWYKDDTLKEGFEQIHNDVFNLFLAIPEVLDWTLNEIDDNIPLLSIKKQNHLQKIWNKFALWFKNIAKKIIR